MSPKQEARPPDQGAGLQDEQRGEHGVTSNVDDDAEVWASIRTGWIWAGDAMPRRGSLAWRCLPADDPVRLASEAAENLGAAGDLRRHGPAVARALAVSR
jgi:hypothetical protein